MRNRRKSAILVQSLAGCMGVGLVLYGCGGGGMANQGGGFVSAFEPQVQTPTLNAKKAATEAAALTALSTGDYYSKTLSSVFPNGSKGLSYAGEYNMTGSKNGIAPTIVMRAAYTATDLYVKVEWTDPTLTHDMRRRRFLFNALNDTGGAVTGWSSQLNEDGLSVAFDIKSAGDATGTFKTKGCAVACHGSMNPTTGSMDVWSWRAGTSNPMGYASDQVADAAGRRNDAGNPIEVRNWKVTGNIASGPGTYRNPASGLQTVTLPNPAEGTSNLDPNLLLLKSKAIPLAGSAVAGQSFFNTNCSGCHSPLSGWKARFASRGLSQTDAQTKTFMTSSNHPGAYATVGMTLTNWNDIFAYIRSFTGVPGYSLQTPTGSSSDLVVMNSKTAYLNGKYSVIVRRKLMTNNADDVQFNLAVSKDYVFGVAVMDKDGKNHAGSAIQHLKFL